MIEFDLLAFYRTVLVFALAYCAVVGGYRYIRAYNDLSRGQKFYLGASLALLMSPVVGNIEALFYADGWRWRLIPSTIGVILFFIYLMEPFDHARRRFGREPFDPKGPKEL